MSQAETDQGDNKRLLDRMIFFSDAVFAIALTLLVLELRPPQAAQGDEAGLWTGFAGLAPNLVAFLISFALAGGWWLVHMSATRSLQRFDWPTAICNLLFLLWIALFPFAAAFFGANIWSAAALAVYWIIAGGAAFSMTLMQFVMTRGGGKLVGGQTGRQRLGLLLMTLAPALAFTLCAWSAIAGHLAWARFGWVVMLPAFVIAPLLMRPAKAKPAKAPKLRAQA